MKKKNPFAKLEEKLNLAKTAIEASDEAIEDLGITDLVDLSTGEVVEYHEEAKELSTIPEEVFTLDILKKDFMMIRQILMGMVASGQRLLQSSGELDATELKASQIEAISSLNTSLVNNMKTLMDIYEQITKIEKHKYNKLGSQGEVSNVNMGTQTTNNIVFQGSANDLMEILNQPRGQ